MTEVPSNEAYYVAETDETIGRLIRASELLAQDVRDGFRRTDLRPGDKVLEIGCGPLGGLRELSDLVGPQGTVVGVDLDQASLQHARAILERAGRENVRLVHANVNGDPSDELRRLGPFDAAYCRFVLMHQPDPAETLRRIAALLRPGGHVVAHELLEDPPPRSEPAVPEIGQFWSWLREVGQRVGAAPDVARQFHTVCRRAGLREVGQRLFGLVQTRDAWQGIQIWQESVRASGPAIARHGVAPEGEIEVVRRRLAEAAGWEFAVLFPMVCVELVAQVPPAA
jgi:ubiquinone/menaquinone biosynthesis C-methylase UbiE